MSTNGTKADHTLSPAQIEPLKNKIWEVKELLELEGEFQKSDAVKLLGKDVNVRFWTVKGAWKIVGASSPNPSDTKINVYRWNRSVRKFLKAYVERESKLPCGHRAHIYNLPNKEGYSCRFCDDWPQYDRQTVENCL